MLQATLAVVLLVLGLLGARWIVAAAPEPPREDELSGPRPVPVQVHTLQEVDIPRVLEATGTLEPAREAVLASELGGRVDFVSDELRDGAEFREGDVLLRVDTATLDGELAAERTAAELSRARLRAAEADLAGAQAGVDSLEARRDLLAEEEARWRGLVERGKAEASRLDQARSQRLAAEAAASDARRGLVGVRSSIDAGRLEVRLADERIEVLVRQRSKAEVKAPFSGRFASAGVPALGSVLAPLAPFGFMLDDGQLRLAVEVHEDDLGALTLGVSARAEPLSQPGRILEGQVCALGARVDPRTRCVRVEVLFAGAGSRPSAAAPSLPAGTFVRAELDGQPFARALWVPESWLTYREGQALAFVVTDADAEGGPTVERRVVTFESGLHGDTSMGRGRIITSGLVAGETIVTSSLPLLGDGAPVVLLGDQGGAAASVVVEGPGANR